AGGLAALIHPDRLRFLRWPAPWVAIVTFVVAMLPHLMWLKQVDFVPLTYAGDTYSLTDRAQIDDLALGYVLHNLALLAAPVVLGAIALGWRPWRLTALPGLGCWVCSGVYCAAALCVALCWAVVGLRACRRV